MTARKEQDAVDLDLMRRIADDEEHAVEEMYDRFGSLVYRMAYQAMPTRADADDAVQEVFVRLWKTAERFDPKRAALVTWVMLLTRRHLVDRLRRTRARIKTGAIEESAVRDERRETEVVGVGLERNERFAQVMDKVSELPELQQSVVTRAYLGGQTLRQISEELGTPLGTVKSALSRALVRLRERAGEELST
jgi:RNA polymerase sigma-70 factor (ECF subfamily)